MNTRILCAIGTVLCPVISMAADEVVDGDLPQTFDPAVVTPLLQNSPFTRTVSPSDSLILTGIAYIDAKPVATILNKETKQSYVVSEKPNALGWTLNEATPTTDLNRAQAKITVGGEVVSIRYDKDALTPEALKKRDSSNGPGGPPSGDRHGDGDRYRRSYGPAPDPEQRAKYEALSEEGKSKLREKFMESREKLMNATPEERAAYMKKVFDRVVEEDASKRGKKN